MSTTIVEPSRFVRDHFAEVLERDVPTIVTRHGRQIAAVVSIDDWRYYEELESRELHRLLEERRGEVEQSGYSLDEVLQETLARRL